MWWSKIKTLAPVAPWVLVALCVASALLYLRYARVMPPTYNPAPQPVATANEPKVVTKTVIKTVLTPGPERIVYLPTPQVQAAIPGAVSPDVAADNGARILAVAEIPPHTGKTVASAIMQTDAEGTARTRIDYKQMPPSFWSLKKEFGLRAGAGSGGLIVGEVYARPLRAGPIEVELRGFVRRTDADGGDFGGAILLDYRF